MFGYIYESVESNYLQVGVITYCMQSSFWLHLISVFIRNVGNTQSHQNALYIIPADVYIHDYQMLKATNYNYQFDVK